MYYICSHRITFGGVQERDNENTERLIRSLNVIKSCKSQKLIVINYDEYIYSSVQAF